MQIFVQELFNKLNKDNVQYAILRNYQSLPDKPSDTNYFDLDLLVASRDLKNYTKIVEKIVTKLDLLIVKKIEREYVKTIRIAHIDSDGRIDSIQLDSHISGQNWWGFFYMTEETILKKRQTYNNYFVVNDFHQNLFNWLDKLFWGNYVKNKYKNNIVKVLFENKEEFESFLREIFGRVLSAQLIDKVGSGNLEGTLAFRGEMIKRLRKYSILNFPLLTLTSNIKFYYYELLLHVFPPGLCCLVDESNGPFLDECYEEFKKVILGDQTQLQYDGGSKVKWLKFYFKEVFPIVRKGGFVLIRSSNNSKPISKINIIQDDFHADTFKKILECNKKRCFMGTATAYIRKNTYEESFK